MDVTRAYTETAGQKNRLSNANNCSNINSKPSEEEGTQANEPSTGDKTKRHYRL